MTEQTIQNINLHLRPVTSYETAKVTQMAEGKVEVKVPVVPSMLNQRGTLHGGVLFTLCDTVAGMVMGSLDRIGVTLSSSINYIKAVNAGSLCISGEVAHAGRTTAVITANVTDDNGALIATSNLTMFFLTGIETA